MPRPSAPAAAKKRRQKAGRPKKQNRTSKLDSAAGDDSDDSNVEDDDFEGMDGYKDGGYHPVKVRPRVAVQRSRRSATVVLLVGRAARVCALYASPSRAAPFAQIGEVYNSRYRVVEKLGWGHFSTVWQCEDFIDGGRLVALKVQKSARHYTEAAADEISILDFVSEQADAAGQDVPVVRLLDTFQHDGPNGQREASQARACPARECTHMPSQFCGRQTSAGVGTAAAFPPLHASSWPAPRPLPPPPPQTRAWCSSFSATTCSV